MPERQRVRPIGRPRLYANNAAKQKAQRERSAREREQFEIVANVAIDLSSQVRRAAMNGDPIANELSDGTNEGTLAKVTAYWRRRADVASRSQVLPTKPKRLKTGKIPAK